MYFHDWLKIQSNSNVLFKLLSRFRCVGVPQLHFEMHKQVTCLITYRNRCVRCVYLHANRDNTYVNSQPIWCVEYLYNIIGVQYNLCVLIMCDHIWCVVWVTTFPTKYPRPTLTHSTPAYRSVARTPTRVTLQIHMIMIRARMFSEISICSGLRYITVVIYVLF